MNIFESMNNQVLLVGQGGGMMSVECLTGVMRAFEEYGMIPGQAHTSSGSTLFSSLYYSGHESAWFRELMQTRKVSEFFHVCVPGALSTMCSCARHMIDNDGVKKLLEQEMTGLASLRVMTSLTRMIDWESIHMPATPATALAATSIPFLFKPVMIDSILYGDGGVLDNIPAPAKNNLCQYDHVFVFLCPKTVYNDTTEDGLITGLLELLDGVMNREYKELERQKYFDEPNVTLIQPEDGFGGGLLNWSPKFQLRDYCYELTKGLLS